MDQVDAVEAMEMKERIVFGSMKQSELMGTHENERKLVLRMPVLLPATEAAKQLADLLSTYNGDKSALLFGYWDYGAEIGVTAPATRQQ